MADLTEDIRTYQLTYNHITEAEDHALNEHSNAIDSLEAELKELKKLMKTTERVEYDMEAYVRDAKARVAKVKASMQAFNDAVVKFDEQIRVEASVASKSAEKKKKK